MRHLALAVVAATVGVPAALADPSTRPPKEESIDSAAALAALQAVIADNPSVDYPAVIIDVCPFGDQREIAAAVNEVVPINPRVLSETQTHAWVNPDSPQPGVGCWAAYDSLDEPGIFWVEVYGRDWNGGTFEGITWGDRWERVDETEEPYLNGQLATGCLLEEGGTDRVCIAQWYDPGVGFQLELELHTNDGSVAAADATAALQALLPTLAAALTG
jgi:hypothetical protein